ncbi:MAG: endonuclease domain-containing protein [Actinomycetota bacterium]|nr:endonuclease domain-containing protein [Actinomycetota bacterium]
MARVDFAYPELMLAIEVDGFRWHGGRIGWDRDQLRRNKLTTMSWRVLHIVKEHMSGAGTAAVTLVREARSSALDPF